MLKDYPEKQKQDSERKIVAALGDKELTFSELEKAAKLSSRTLSDRLAAMEKEGEVVRYVDTNCHPPRVNYSLAREALKKYGSIIDAYDRSVRKGKFDLILAGQLALNEVGDKRFDDFITFSGQAVRYAFLSAINDMLKAGLDEKYLTWFMGLTYYPRVNEVARNLYEVMLKNRNKSMQFLDKQVSIYNKLLGQTEDAL